jgi:bilin biosynthesis protein
MTLSQQATDDLLEQVQEQIDRLTLDVSDEALFRQLIECFADTRGIVRLKIAETLAEIGEPTTLALVDALASHPNPVVRRACAKTLTLIADPRAIPQLVNAFLHDEDTVVQGSSVGALARTGRAAAPDLLNILDTAEHSETIKGHAAWALAFMGAEAKDILYQALQSESETVRAAVVGAIAKVAQDDPQSTHYDTLMQSLNDSSEIIRSEAATGLANLKYQPAIPALSQLLQHPEADSRKSAALALMKMGDISLIETLQTTLTKEAEASVQSVLKLAISQLQKQSTQADDWDQS